MSEHQIAGRVTFDGRIANNDICAKCEEVWPCDFTQARMQRDALRTALTAAQATIAQRDAQVAELTAALQAVMRRIDRTGKACWCPPIFDDRVFHTSDCLRASELMARTPAAPQDSHNP